MHLFNSIARSCTLFLFLNQPVFQENKICNFEIHLSNDGIFSYKTGEHFNFAKIF